MMNGISAPHDIRSISRMAEKIRLNMRTANKHKHLNEEDREDIHTGLDQGLYRRKSKETAYARRQRLSTIRRITASLQRPAGSKISVRGRTVGNSASNAIAAIFARTSSRSSARSSSGSHTSATHAKRRSAARQTGITTGP